MYMYLYMFDLRPDSVSQAHGSGLETVVLTRPMDSRLEHVNFSLLFSTLSPRKIIQLFSSLLLERRVILCAHSLSLISGCAHALLALLYPFEWQVLRGVGGCDGDARLLSACLRTKSILCGTCNSLIVFQTYRLTLCVF